MTFYQQLSKHYDEIFPAGPAEMRFVGGLLAGRERILDIGCGTGNKTAVLAGNAAVTAFDSDAGMIEIARARHAAPNIAYQILDMAGIAGAFAPDSFDAALCLGNTLAHVEGPDALVEILRQARAVLAEDGFFIAQILNYDRIIAKNVTELPLVDTENVVFRRRYDWRDGRMHFVTDLELKNGGGSYRNDIVLRPIRRCELDHALAEAGFGTVDHYGSYAGEDYGPESFHLIVRAHAWKGDVKCR